MSYKIECSVTMMSHSGYFNVTLKNLSHTLTSAKYRPSYHAMTLSELVSDRASDRVSECVIRLLTCFRVII